MDRDYYLQRHDEELEAASIAACAASREAHQRLARAYAEVLGRFGKPVAVVSNPSPPTDRDDQAMESRVG